MIGKIITFGVATYQAGAENPNPIGPCSSTNHHEGKPGEQSLSFNIYAGEERLMIMPTQYVFTWLRGIVEPGLSRTTKGGDGQSGFTSKDGDLATIL